MRAVENCVDWLFAQGFQERKGSQEWGTQYTRKSLSDQTMDAPIRTCHKAPKLSIKLGVTPVTSECHHHLLFPGKLPVRRQNPGDLTQEREKKESSRDGGGRKAQGHNPEECGVH